MDKISKKKMCGRPSEHRSLESQNNDAALQIRFSNKLNKYSISHDLNRSEAREKILEIIIKEAKHFRPFDLLERLQRKFPEVGKATLYRNLPIFVDAGILKLGPVDSEGNIFYELCLEETHHDHIVCMDCDRIFEFHDQVIETQQMLLSSELKFEAKHHSHVIYANCQFLEK